MLSLVMNPGLPSEEIFVLLPGTLTIGRTIDNGVHCLHKSLSRRHAQLEFDGRRITLTDLRSKNGVFVAGKRVEQCVLSEGDAFRCGDITFLVDGATARTPKKVEGAAQTLPSVFALGPNDTVRPPEVSPEPRPVVVTDGDQRHRERLFLLIRATELCVSEMSIDALLEELAVLALQVFKSDRVVVLTLDSASLEMRPRVIRSFAPPVPRPFSQRVVDWVVDCGGPASFAHVTTDRSLPGDPADDAGIRGAMCAPISAAGGTTGVIYVDSLAHSDHFRPEDLALLRGLANLAAVAIENASLRGAEREDDRIPATR